MSDLTLTYMNERERAWREGLDQFAADEARIQSEQPLGPPTPEKVEPPKQPGALGKGVSTIWDTFQEGAKNFVEGLATHVQTQRQARASGATTTLGQDFAPLGQSFLGTLQMLMALPAGAGAAVQQALANYAPGKEQAVALAGGENSAAGLLRTMFAVPNLLLDPKMKEADPQVVASMLLAPMTYGELINVVTQFAATPVMLKGGTRLLRGKAVPVEPAGPPAPETVAGPPVPTPAGPPKALPPAPIVTPPPETPMDVAMRLRQVLESIEQPPTEVTRAAAREAGKTPFEQPSRGVVSTLERIPEELTIGEPPAAPLKSTIEMAMEGQPVRPGDLTSALEIATKRAEQIISEEIGKAAPEETSGMQAVFKDQTGAVNVGLIARMAIGGAIGGTQGDTPEDRIRNALIGAGLGLGLSAVLGKKLSVEVAKPAEKIGVGVGTAVKRPAVQAKEAAFQPNYARLEQTPDVRVLTVNLHRMMKESILERKGPPKGHDATAQAAEDLITTNKMTPERILSLGPEDMLNREEGVAARMIAERSRVHVQELRTKLDAGESIGPEGTLKNAFAVSAALSRNVRVMQTRQAQALEANKIKVSGAEPAYYKPEDVIHLADEMPKDITDAALSERLGALPKPEQIERAGLWTSVLPKALLEGMYFSMLSGKALLKNAVSNVLVMPLAIGVRAASPYLPKWGKPGPGVYPGEATQMMIAFHEVNIDLWRGLHHMEKWAQEAGAGETAKIEVKYAPSITAENFGLVGPAGQAIDWLGIGLRSVGNFMQATDRWAKGANGHMQGRVEAFRQAIGEGLEGDAFWTRVETLANDPTQLSGSAIRRIRDFGETQTFTKDFEGRILGAMQRGPEGPWAQLLYRMTFAPFFRTPVRIGEYHMTMTPGLNLLAKQFWSDMLSGDPVKIQTAQAKVAVGAGLMASFGYLASQGLITGNYPADPTLKQNWINDGIQEKSWWDFIGKKYRSYDGFEPLSSTVSAAADVTYMLKQLPESDGLTLFMGLVLSEINNLDSKTYTLAASQLLDVFRSQGPDSQVDKALELVRKRLSAFSPAFLREIEKGVDPTQRQVKPSGAYDNTLAREFDALKRNYMAQIPGLSDLKDEHGNWIIPPYRDPLTGQIEASESIPFSLMPGKTPKDNPVYAEIRRLGGGISFKLPDYLGPTAPGANVGLTEEKPFAGVRLTPAEIDRRAVIMTQEVKSPYGLHLQQEMERLIRSGEYARQSDGPWGGKIQEIARTWRDFRTMAEMQLRAKSKPLDAEVTRREQEKQILRAPTELQPALRSLGESLRR